MKRNIINIDQEKCNGCGQCAKGCPEGAIQMIDGKAKLVSEIFCDGLGACIGECPVDAITIEEREAEAYSEEKVIANIAKHGVNTIAAHLKHLKDHGEEGYLNTAVSWLKNSNIKIPADLLEEKKEEKMACGCPGSMAREISRNKNESHGHIEINSELTQWPVQLQLLNPEAPYFKNSDIVIAADCVPFAYADFHRKFLKGKKLIIFCPKLDTTIDSYIQKLTEIFKQNIKSISIVHMEVPCCFGVNRIVDTALEKSGKDIPVEDITISVQGEIV